MKEPETEKNKKKKKKESTTYEKRKGNSVNVMDFWNTSIDT